jgi:membrane AbrB-like protein
MVGLRFTRQALGEAWRVLPAVFASIFMLIVLCAALGLVLSHVMGIDPLTAFLATSPGGVDAVAIIASSSGVDVPFVMAFQVARLFAVMLAGPALAQFATRRLEASA